MTTPSFTISISLWHEGRQLEVSHEGNEISFVLPPELTDPDPEVIPEPEVRPDPEKGLTLTSTVAVGTGAITSVAGSAVPGAGVINRDAPAVFAADFTGLDGSKGGLIFELGGNVIGSYVGFAQNGEFHVRAGGGGSALPAGDAAYLIVPADAAPFGDGTLVVELQGGDTAVRAWWNGKTLGTPVARASGKGSFAGSDKGAYLTTGASICTGEVAAAASHKTASDLRYYYNQKVAL